MNLLPSLLAVLILSLFACGALACVSMAHLFLVVHSLRGFLRFLCRLCLSHRLMGAIARSLPHPHHLRAAEIASLDQGGAAREPLGHGRRHRPDGPGGPAVPLALPEHERGDLRGADPSTAATNGSGFSAWRFTGRCSSSSCGTCASSSSRSAPASAASRPSTVFSRSACRPST